MFPPVNFPDDWYNDGLNLMDALEELREIECWEDAKWGDNEVYDE